MSIEVQATYEDGVLKPDQPLPLTEHQRVVVVVQDIVSTSNETGIAAAYGIIGWKGDPEVARKIALDPEFGIQESP